MTAECSEVNGFYLPMVICVNAESISQNDLLLLSNKKVVTLSWLTLCQVVIVKI